MSDGGTNRRGRILLLTGRPGVGKTTALRQVAGELEGLRIGGFYTEEVREGGRRVGFRGVPFRGRDAGGPAPARARTIAHVEIGGSPRVSRYGVDVEAIDELARRSLGREGEADVHLLDEIGKMECLSKVFVARVRDLLEGEGPLVATIGRGGAGLIRETKERPGAVLWTVTPGNRDAIPGRVLAWLGERLDAGPAPG